MTTGTEILVGQIGTDPPTVSCGKLVKKRKETVAARQMDPGGPVPPKGEAAWLGLVRSRSHNERGRRNIAKRAEQPRSNLKTH